MKEVGRHIALMFTPKETNPILFFIFPLKCFCNNPTIQCLAIFIKICNLYVNDQCVTSAPIDSLPVARLCPLSENVLDRGDDPGDELIPGDVS